MSEIFNSIQASEDVTRFVDHSFDVVNKIHAILEKQGKTQRDLAVMLGKNESEVSKWMRGTHNFTLKSIAKIEAVLGENIFNVIKEDEMVVKKDFINLYSSLLKHLEFTFEKAEVMEKPQLSPQSYTFNTLEFAIKGNNTIIEVSPENDPGKAPRYDMAA